MGKNPAPATARTPLTVLTPSSSPSSAAPTTAITLTPPPLAPSPSLWENGTVLVAGITLVGVIITVSAAAWNAAQERKLTREQARLDRDSAALEAHKERVATTRRQVYLEAVEALHKAQSFLGGLAKQDLTNLDVQAGIGPLMAAVNKIAVVGEMGTVRTARELSAMVNRRLFRGMVSVLPLTHHKSLAKHHHTEWDASQVEMKRILAAMAHHNETLKNDPAGFAALTKSFEIQQQRAKYASTAEQKARATMNKGTQEYAEFYVADSRELALHLDVLADRIRKELNIETDFEEFRAQTVAMQVAINESMAELKAGIEKFQEGARESPRPA